MRITELHPQPNWVLSIECGIANLRRSASGIARNAIEQIVPGVPRLRVLHQAFILSGCRDSRGRFHTEPDKIGIPGRDVDNRLRANALTKRSIRFYTEENQRSPVYLEPDIHSYAAIL